MTKNACTEVLGTAFNVWSRHDETRIIVKNGKVRLKRSPHDTLQVEIVRNQMSRVTQQLPPEKPNTVNADQKIGWMEGRLVFEKTTLLEIIEEIERYYGIRINLLDETLARETLTASYNNTSLSNVLQSLSLSCGTNYRYLSEQQIDFGMSAKDM